MSDKESVSYHWSSVASYTLLHLDRFPPPPGTNIYRFRVDPQPPPGLEIGASLFSGLSAASPLFLGAGLRTVDPVTRRGQPDQKLRHYT